MWERGSLSKHSIFAMIGYTWSARELALIRCTLHSQLISIYVDSSIRLYTLDSEPISVCNNALWHLVDLWQSSAMKTSMTLYE